MTKKETKEVANVVSDATLAMLNETVPQEATFQRVMLPRISFVAKDRTEGKGKSLKVTTEGGTFTINQKNEDGEWEEKEIGKEIEVRMFYNRRQLRKWDNSAENFISSPLYDNDEDVVPLFQDKEEIDRGTQAELQAKYPPEAGRKTSSLQDERVLYVVYNDEVYTLNVKGGSKYEFFNFAKKQNPATVVIKITSEEKTHGATTYYSMVFNAVRPITEDEARDTIVKANELKDAIAQEKAYYASPGVAEAKKETDEEFEKF